MASMMYFAARRQAWSELGLGVGRKSAMVKPVASQVYILEDEVHFVERVRDIALSVLR